MWIVVELAPHVLDEPAQCPARVVDQRHHALAGSRAPSALAMADMQLAEPTQLRLDVSQIQMAQLVDP